MLCTALHCTHPGRPQEELEMEERDYVRHITNTNMKGPSGEDKCCTAPRYFALHCTALHGTVLYCTAPYCTALH
jgi:hypothetical protein